MTDQQQLHSDPEGSRPTPSTTIDSALIEELIKAHRSTDARVDRLQAAIEGLFLTPAQQTLPQELPGYSSDRTPSAFLPQHHQLRRRQTLGNNNRPPRTYFHNPGPQGFQTHAEDFRDEPLQRLHYKSPRVDLPRFADDDVKSWLQLCSMYFLFNGVPPKQRVILAAMHLDGEARSWSQSKLTTLVSWTWTQFSHALIDRFANEGYENVVAELSHLRQEGSVKEYHSQFEAMKSRVLERRPELSEGFFIDQFMGNLRPEIRDSVQMFHPNSMEAAYSLARLQESTVDSFLGLVKPNYRYPNPKPSPGLFSNRVGEKADFTSSWPNNTTPAHSPINPPGFTQRPNLQPTKSYLTQQPKYAPYPTRQTTSSPSFTPSPSPATAATPIKHLTPSDLANQKAKGLCFYCDEQFMPGHRCNRGQIFMMCPEPEEYVDPDQPPQAAPPDNGVRNEPSMANISLHVISGGSSFKTLTIAGVHKNHRLDILLDSGNTHNFLDSRLAKHLNLSVHRTTPLSVQIADGGTVTSTAVVSEFVWQTKGINFSTEVRLLKLGGCDMVLGVQFFLEVGPILFDFAKGLATIHYKGNEVQLTGSQFPQTSVQFVSYQKLCNWVNKTSSGLLGHLVVAQATVMGQPTPPLITELITEYAELFAKPTTLPPERVHDHQINLLPNALPVKGRPYRYPHIQKNEIEKMISEMLQMGVIRPSISPFSSPVLMVRKKDGSWRLR